MCEVPSKILKCHAIPNSSQQNLKNSCFKSAEKLVEDESMWHQ